MHLAYIQANTDGKLHPELMRATFSHSRCNRRSHLQFPVPRHFPQRLRATVEALPLRPTLELLTKAGVINQTPGKR